MIEHTAFACFVRRCLATCALEVGLKWRRKRKKLVLAELTLHDGLDGGRVGEDFECVLRRRRLRTSGIHCYLTARSSAVSYDR